MHQTSEPYMLTKRKQIVAHLKFEQSPREEFLWRVSAPRSEFDFRGRMGCQSVPRGCGPISLLAAAGRLLLVAAGGLLLAAAGCLLAGCWLAAVG